MLGQQQDALWQNYLDRLEQAAARAIPPRRPSGAQGRLRTPSLRRS